MESRHKCIMYCSSILRMISHPLSFRALFQQLIAMGMSWWEATITIIMFTKSPRGVKAYNYND